MKKGYIQIYTGDGKGKTSAALGLALRALGNGFKVLFIQFLKSGDSSEISVVTQFGLNFKVLNYAKLDGFLYELTENGKKILFDTARAEFEKLLSEMEKLECDVLILDEIMGAIHSGIIKTEQMILLMDKKPVGMELVLTGRNAPLELVEKADLVTCMQNVKHYADSGVNARVGIEY